MAKEQKPTKETFQKRFSPKERYEGYGWLVMHILPKVFRTTELVRGHKSSWYDNKDVVIEVIVDSHKEPECVKEAIGENVVEIGKLEITKIMLGLETNRASDMRNIMRFINCTLDWLLNKDIPRLSFRGGEEDIKIECVEDLRLLWEQIGIEKENIPIKRIEDWGQVEHTSLSSLNNDNIDKLRKYFGEQHQKNLETLATQAGEGGGRATKETNTFRQEGDFWEIVYKGDPLPPIRDLLGFHYIRQVLYNPGGRFKALEIYRKVKEDTPIIEAGEDEEGLSISSALTSGQRQEVMDSMSREDVGKAIEECKQKIAEADEESNIEEAEEWQRKLEELEEQLSSGGGLPNRPRYFSDDNERARKTVTKAIDKALEEIKNYNEPLYTHLDKSITRGVEVYYHPTEPTTWE